MHIAASSRVLQWVAVWCHRLVEVFRFAIPQQPSIRLPPNFTSLERTPSSPSPPSLASNGLVVVEVELDHLSLLSDHHFLPTTTNIGSYLVFHSSVSCSNSYTSSRHPTLPSHQVSRRTDHSLPRNRSLLVCHILITPIRSWHQHRLTPPEPLHRFVLILEGA